MEWNWHEIIDIDEVMHKKITKILKSGGITYNAKEISI